MFINMLATIKSCGNKCFFDQYEQPGKITSQLSVLMIKYLVAVSFELRMMYMCNVFGYIAKLITVVAEIVIAKSDMHIW